MVIFTSLIKLSIWGYVLLTFVLSIVSEPEPDSDNMNFQFINMRDYGMKASDYASWQSKCCIKFRSLLMKKEYAMQKLSKAVKTMVRSTDMSEQWRKYYVSTFRVFQKELNESEHLIFQSIAWLNKALQGDLKDVINIKESSKARLEALRDATLKEEQEYNAILEAEKHRADSHKGVQNQTSSIINVISDILQEVSQVADKLETDLSDHVFDRERNRVNGGNIETVVKMTNTEEEEETPANNLTKRSVEQGLVMKLVDSQENQYVLSKSKDSTVPQEDPNLIMDVIYVVITAYLFGFICNVLHFPTMFGYIMSGIVLGPPLCNVLKSVVQLETLGEFGVFFILFSVGLEFSPDKLKKVFRVATVSSVCMMLVTILLLVSLGQVVGAVPLESAFIGASLSLSSTPLVVRFLSGNKDSKSDVSSGMDYGTVLLGVLIMQDVLLGLLMAILPRVAMTSQPSTTWISIIVLYLAMMFKLMAALFAVLAGCWLTSTFMIGPIYSLLHSKGSRELTVLTTVTLVFLVMMVTDYVNVSMELGSFLAGVMLSAQGGHLSESVELLVQPLKDFLSTIFFASIGLHIFPTFLLSELNMLMSLTVATVASKFVVSAVVLAFTLPSGNSHVKWIVSAGLAQVSEFSFVLGSRARRLDIISREVYLLVLSVTTLSLLLAPVLWNSVLWQLRLRTSYSLSRQHSSP